MMPQHKLIDTSKATVSGAIGILGILLLTLMFIWIEKRNAEMNLSACPAPGHGQQLIGQSHVEADGYPGELYCTYSTRSIHNREQVIMHDQTPAYSRNSTKT